MNKKSGLAAILVTIAAALLGSAMRVYFLKHAVDENGLVYRGSKLPLIMAVFIVLMLAAAALLLRPLDKRPTYFGNFSARPLWLLPAAIAACAFFAGGLMSFLAATAVLDRWLAFAAMAAGILLLVQTVFNYLGKKQSFLLLLLPCLWLIFKLIVDYKGWSKDAVLSDYCFMLLADITAMLSAYHLAGFSFDRGKRRLTAFWCSAATLFCTVSLPDAFLHGDYTALLIYLGLLLWLLPSMLQLCISRSEPEAPADEVPPEQLL